MEGGVWVGGGGGTGRLQLLYKQEAGSMEGPLHLGEGGRALLGSIWIGNGEGKVSKSVAGGRNSM